MSFPPQVKIVEVSPRDGLQNEKIILPTATKIELINRLASTGLREIEVTSFVSPKWIPQLADHSEVLQGIDKFPHIHYPVLIPNTTGLALAIIAGVKDIAVFTTPSESFSMHNTHCSVAESLTRLRAVIAEAKQHTMSVRGYLSCVLGCPYEGAISPLKVAELADKLYQLGCDEISLGDTIGVGTPLSTVKLIQAVNAYVPLNRLAVHFHDTYGQALVNIYAALQMGIHIVDCAVSGLGGCPYAKGASGNVATEDVVYFLDGLQIETGVNLKKLIDVGRFITAAVGKKSNSKVNLAAGNQESF